MQRYAAWTPGGTAWRRDTFPHDLKPRLGPREKRTWFRVLYIYDHKLRRLYKYTATVGKPKRTVKYQYVLRTSDLDRMQYV